jgi:hypothetical protein
MTNLPLLQPRSRGFYRARPQVETVLKKIVAFIAKIVMQEGLSTALKTMIPKFGIYWERARRTKDW